MLRSSVTIISCQLSHRWFPFYLPNFTHKFWVNPLHDFQVHPKSAAVDQYYQKVSTLTNQQWSDTNPGFIVGMFLTIRSPTLVKRHISRPNNKIQNLCLAILAHFQLYRKVFSRIYAQILYSSMCTNIDVHVESAWHSSLCV